MPVDQLVMRSRHQDLEGPADFSFAVPRDSKGLRMDDRLPAPGVLDPPKDVGSPVGEWNFSRPVTPRLSVHPGIENGVSAVLHGHDAPSPRAEDSPHLAQDPPQSAIRKNAGDIDADHGIERPALEGKAPPVRHGLPWRQRLRFGNEVRWNDVHRDDRLHAPSPGQLEEPLPRAGPDFQDPPRPVRQNLRRGAPHDVEKCFHPPSIRRQAGDSPRRHEGTKNTKKARRNNLPCPVFVALRVFVPSW